MYKHKIIGGYVEYCIGVIRVINSKLRPHSPRKKILNYASDVVKLDEKVVSLTARVEFSLSYLLPADMLDRRRRRRTRLVGFSVKQTGDPSSGAVGCRLQVVAAVVPAALCCPATVHFNIADGYLRRKGRSTLLS